MAKQFSLPEEQQEAIRFLRQVGIDINPRSSDPEQRRRYIVRQYNKAVERLERGELASREAGRGEHGETQVAITHKPRHAHHREEWEIDLRGLSDVEKQRLGSGAYKALWQAAGSPPETRFVLWGLVRYKKAQDCREDILTTAPMNEASLRHAFTAATPEKFAEMVQGDKWCEVWTIAAYPQSRLQGPEETLSSRLRRRATSDE